MRPYVNDSSWRNRLLTGYADVTESDVVPGAGSDFTLELDERIVPNGTLIVSVDGWDPLTIVPWGTAPGPTQASVSYDLPLVKVHASHYTEPTEESDGTPISVTYTPGGGVMTSARYQELMDAATSGTVERLEVTGAAEAGAATILSAATSAVVPVAGLVAGDLVAVCYQTADNGGGALWAVADEESFTVKCSAAVSSDTAVNWRVIH